MTTRTLRDDLACLNRGKVNPQTKNVSMWPETILSLDGVELYLTCEDRSHLAACVTDSELAIKEDKARIQDVVRLDPQTRFQTILGFGGTIIDSDISNLQRLNAKQRKKAIEALVGNSGLRFNLMRLAFGSTDWNRDWNFYTYCDLKPGEIDADLGHFSIARDRELGTLDTIRAFQEANPDIRFLASVWAVPAWMKQNDNLIHGFFDSRFTDIYADYWQISRLLPRGSVRIASNPVSTAGIRNLAFQQPDGHLVLFVANTSDNGLDIAFQVDGAARLVHSPARSLLTIRCPQG